MSRLLLFTKLIYLTFLSSREGGHYTCQVEYAAVHSRGYYLLNVNTNTTAATLTSLWRRDLSKYLIKVILVKYLKTAYLKLVDSKLQCKKSPNASFFYIQYTTFFTWTIKHSRWKMHVFKQIMMYSCSPGFQRYIEMAVKISKSSMCEMFLELIF